MLAARGGARHHSPELALLGTFTVYLSPAVLAEYREDPCPPQVFTPVGEDHFELLEGIEEVAVVVMPDRRVGISPDEEDNRLLECAEAAEADFLVTGNRKHFPESFRATRVIAPRDFLTELGF